MAERQLPATAYVVLGLVSVRPTSGHELAGFARRSVGNFFPLTRSHIYLELDRLCRLGFLDAAEVNQERLPTKRVYAITPAGAEVLRRWLDERARARAPAQPVPGPRLLRRPHDPGRLAALLDDYEEAARPRATASPPSSTGWTTARRRSSAGRRRCSASATSRRSSTGWPRSGRSSSPLRSPPRPRPLAPRAGRRRARGRRRAGRRGRGQRRAGRGAGGPVLSRLGDMAAAHPRRMALMALLVASSSPGSFGGPAAGMLKAQNAFRDPKSDSTLAAIAVERATGAESSPGVLAVVAAPPGSPAVASAARAIAGVPGVVSVAAPAPGKPGGLVSSDGRSSIVAATLVDHGSDDTVKRIEHALRGRSDVTLGGGDVAGVQTGKQATADLGFAELLAFPLLAILAFFIFRGVAALLPLGVGMTSILGTFLVLRGVNAVLPLSQFALNLVIGLGPGSRRRLQPVLVWRLREELGRGADVPQALARR